MRDGWGAACGSAARWHGDAPETATAKSTYRPRYRWKLHRIPWRCPAASFSPFRHRDGLLAGLVLGTGTVAAAKGGNHKVLDVQLIGLAVQRTVIAGLTGAGHAWSIDEGNAKLFSDGRLLINVEGLVLTPEGTNPVGSGTGVVSCNGGATPADIVRSDRRPAVDPRWRRPRQPVADAAEPVPQPGDLLHERAGGWFATSG